SVKNLYVSSPSCPVILYRRYRNCSPMQTFYLFNICGGRMRYAPTELWANIVLEATFKPRSWSIRWVSGAELPIPLILVQISWRIKILKILCRVSTSLNHRDDLGLSSHPINPGSNQQITFEPTFLQYRF